MSTVELYWRTKRARPLGITGVDNVGLDWPAVIDRKNKIVEDWSKGTKPALEKKGITVLQGQAAFTGAHEVQVGAQKVTAEKFILATGSSPARPSIEGVERGVTSDEFLDLKTIPSRMVVLGGGAIGLEFGFCMARAGSRVTVLQSGRYVLPRADDELRGLLLEMGRSAGMEFYTNVTVTRIAEDRTVEATIMGTAKRYPADLVLIATGRPPNISNLNLGKAGIGLERGLIKVNEFLQSASAPHIYGAGDVVSRHQHTPVAWYEGQIVGHNAVKGNEKKVDLKLLPTTIFTIPALSQVGLTEAEARNQGFTINVNRTPFKHNPAAGVREETEGLIKIVYERDTDRILGVHVLGAHAEDLIHIAAVAMRGGLKRAEIGAMHYVFPTLGGGIFDAMAGW